MIGLIYKIDTRYIITGLNNKRWYSHKIGLVNIICKIIVKKMGTLNWQKNLFFFPSTSIVKYSLEF